MYGYPNREAAQIALTEVRKFLETKTGAQVWGILICAYVIIILWHSSNVSCFVRSWRKTNLFISMKYACIRVPHSFTPQGPSSPDLLSLLKILSCHTCRGHGSLLIHTLPRTTIPVTQSLECLPFLESL